MESSRPRTLLLDAEVMAAAVANVSQAICSEFAEKGKDGVAFIGIQAHGVPFARRIAASMKGKIGFEPAVGTLDISMYRDDIGLRKSLPAIYETTIPFDINGKVIVLADDVLQTGRTIRAALDALTDYGRPALIRLAVLVDRGLREFPIRADYAGKLVDLPPEKHVRVRWSEIDGDDSIYAVDRPRKTQ